MTNPHDKWNLYIAAQKQREREKQDDHSDAENRAHESEAELRKLKDLAEKMPAQGEQLTFWQRVFCKRG